MAQEMRTQIAALEVDLGNNPNMPGTNPQKWLSSLQFARSTIITVERTPQLRNQLGSDSWTRLIQALQKLAYQDPDTGGEADIALWCERQWATEVQRQPNSIIALQGKFYNSSLPPWHDFFQLTNQGLGHAWLLKSQKTLARIYREESSPSSSSSTTSVPHRRMRSPALGNRDASRINSQDYVEARDTLRPSLESFDRALAVANAHGGASGDLLTLSAEAFLSFGNVSHPQRNEAYYQKALRLLRAASEIDEYQIEVHLQNFLDENLRYIE
ncbi:hypothetical protein MMC17_001325 [Xylographa soralifera]|nr:hypothetical protein [Xylographa soralifera]